MTWCNLKVFILLFFWASICCMQVCWARHRVVRSSNASEFIPRELDPTDKTFTIPDFCKYVNDSEYDESDRSKRSLESATESDESDLESNYDQEFIECGLVPVEFGCYGKFPNNSVLVPIYENRQFRPTQYMITDETKQLWICPSFFDNSTDSNKFPKLLGDLTLVGTSISFFCILLHIAVFMVFKNLRNLPGYCLFSLCIALVIAYMCIFISNSRKESSDCAVVGVIKAFAFLASFFWMNVMSFDIWRSLRMATAKLRLTGDRPMLIRFAMYCAYAWGIPLLIIISGIIVDLSPGSYEKYRLTINKDTCWFYYKQALLVYFAIPLIVLLSLNVLLFVSSFVMINSATMKQSESKADLWSRFLVCFRLFVVMGLMWFFGVLAAAFNKMWLWVFYVICNVLQGVFIFFSFTFTEKTRKECKKALGKKKSMATRTQVSSQQSSAV